MLIEVPAESVPALQAGLGGVALAALLLGLGPSLAHWRVRRRVWLSDPARLLDPPPATPACNLLSVAAAVVVALGAALVGPSTLVLLALFVALIAVFVITHRAWSALTAGLAMIMVAEWIVLAAGTWLPHFGLNAVFGAALAGVYFAWLTRFWRQQLLHGRAWTTTGRLIPLAGAAAAACALLLAGLVAARAIDRDAWRPAGWDWFWIILTIVLAAGLARRLAARPAEAARGGAAAGLVRLSAALAAGAAALILLALAVSRPAADSRGHAPDSMESTREQ